MRPHLNQQQRDSLVHNPTQSPLSEDHKNDQNSTSHTSKSSRFNLFGCCYNNSDYTQPSKFSIKHLSNRPKTFMDAKTKPNSKASMIYDPPPIEIDQNPPEISYPIDKIFILGETFKIVAKITVHKVSKATKVIDSFTLSAKGMNSSVLNTNTNRNSIHDKGRIKRSRAESAIAGYDVPIEAKKEIFSKYEKGIKAEHWQEITPEKVAIYIAERLACETIIDALCGFGGNTIQFAKTCDFVIGIDIVNNKTIWARHNAKVYGVDHKIDFLTADFMKLRNITADIVFLGPTNTRTKSNEPFSIFRHIKPNPLSLLAKSLGVSYKIALQLPGDTKIEELPQLFHQSLENNGLFSKRFCIEIEKIVNSRDQTECLIVYFGDCSSINQHQENEAIYEYISRNESTEWKRDFPLHSITTLVQKVGIRRSFKYLAEIESEFPKDLLYKPPSLFDCFLNKIISNNIFSKAYINTLLEEEPKIPTLSHQNSSIPNSYNSFSLQSRSLANNNNTSTLISSAPTHSQALGTLPTVVQEKPKGLLSRLVAEHNMKKEQALSSWPEKKPQTNKKEWEEKVSKNSTPGSGNDFIGGFKDSYEVSDLPISSYSVSSDYLKDFSEDENPTRKTTLVNLNDSREGGSDRERRKERFLSKNGRSPLGRTSEMNYKGGKKKDKREYSEENGSRKSLGSGFQRRDELFRSISPKNEGSLEAENAKKSFLLQCGEEF